MAIKGDLAFKWPVKMMSDPYKRINQEELFGTLLKAQMQEIKPAMMARRPHRLPSRRKRRIPRRRGRSLVHRSPKVSLGSRKIRSSSLKGSPL
jgi:hypothetical protein